MNTLTATEARKHFFDVIKGTVKKHEPHYIQHKDGDVVMLSADDYESLQETLDLLSIPGFRNKIKTSYEDIEKGDTVSFDTVFKGI
ncbi:MAG: type II toxin-antitoxin system Phd/YefM family antitoxin [Lentisphaerota bacterium]